MAWRRATDGMATNPDFRIEHRDGADRVVVTPLDAIHQPASLVRLRAQVEALLPEIEITDLPLMVNIIVLWQTVYIQAALDHLAALGHDIDPADVARLSPLGHPTVNLQGRYRTTSRAPDGGLRPLRTAERHG